MAKGNTGRTERESSHNHQRTSLSLRTLSFSASSMTCAHVEEAVHLVRESSTTTRSRAGGTSSRGGGASTVTAWHAGGN